MDTQTAFKQNLPIFNVQVRGNVVADAEEFDAKSGKNFVTFKVAHTFRKDGTTAFIKVMQQNGETYPSKGDYVEVSGDYTEDQKGEYLNRTLFANEVIILGSKSEAPKKSPPKPATKSKARR